MNVVSNRLPRIMSRSRSGEWIARPASGGLVRALSPILRRTGGRWIGWAGGTEAVPLSALNSVEDGHEHSCAYAAVHLQPTDIHRYYEGFANSTLWPLFHGFTSRTQFIRANWEGYLEANHKFNDVCADHFRDGEVVWVHDYHLIPLASMLRRRMPTSRIGFFLHIPFPTVRDFAKLPWKTEILDFLLAYDLVGLQTNRDRDRLLACVERFETRAHHSTHGGRTVIGLHGRATAIGAFPIGVDFADLSSRAQSAEVETGVTKLRNHLNGRKLVLGVDRLDYSKGLLKRLESFDRLLQDNEELRNDTVMIQLVVPSRDRLPDYAKLRIRLEELVGRIIGRYARPMHCPLQYIYGSVSLDELLALYRSADIALVTPLCDGMNLVAKEYCAAQVDNEGTLVPSEHAGSAEQLSPAASVVDPTDVAGIAGTLAEALAQPVGETRRRMQQLRTIIRGSDVFAWSLNFMRALQQPLHSGSQAGFHGEHFEAASGE
jgi:alpha,alpha-trehalose-phosphate synthase [UDP-forming]